MLRRGDSEEVVLAALKARWMRGAPEETERALRQLLDEQRQRLGNDNGQGRLQ